MNISNPRYSHQWRGRRPPSLRFIISVTEMRASSLKNFLSQRILRWPNSRGTNYRILSRFLFEVSILTPSKPNSSHQKNKIWLVSIRFFRFISRTNFVRIITLSRFAGCAAFSQRGYANVQTLPRFRGRNLRNHSSVSGDRARTPTEVLTPRISE